MAGIDLGCNCRDWVARLSIFVRPRLVSRCRARRMPLMRPDPRADVEISENTPAGERQRPLRKLSSWPAGSSRDDRAHGSAGDDVGSDPLGKQRAEDSDIGKSAGSSAPEREPDARRPAVVLAAPSASTARSPVRPGIVERSDVSRQMVRGQRSELTSDI